MTDESKRMSFSQMCAALPEDFSWGDSLTPDVFQHIEDAILQAATCDAPSADAFAEYRRGVREAFNHANVIRANPHGRNADETLTYIMRTLAELANGDSAPSADAVDAQRYRWLRDVSVPPHNFYLSVPEEFKDVKYSKAEVDAEIDKAIAASAPKV